MNQNVNVISQEEEEEDINDGINSSSLLVPATHNIVSPSPRVQGRQRRVQFSGINETSNFIKDDSLTIGSETNWIKVTAKKGTKKESVVNIKRLVSSPKH